MRQKDAITLCKQMMWKVHGVANDGETVEKIQSLTAFGGFVLGAGVGTRFGFDFRDASSRQAMVHCLRVLADAVGKDV